jgi:flagellar biosynthetic protein FliR
MEGMLSIIGGKLELFFLILVRCAGIFMIAPIFGRRNVPSTFKVGLALMMSIILLGIVEADLAVYTDMFGYTLLIIKEAVVGFLIGFVSYIVFSSIYVAGQIIDMETGFGVVNVLDPQNNIQVPIMGNFLYIIALVIFVTIDGHHMIISALFKSFEMVPLGEVTVSINTVKDLIKILGDTFIIGFKISAPVVTAVFLTDIALGILSRTMPQMNVFMVGIPLKIAVGMFTLMIMVPVFAIILDSIFTNMEEGIFRVLTHMR